MFKDDKFYQLEEDFFSSDRKAHRKERKRAATTDRSQFKKTDQDQLKKQALEASQKKNDSLLPEGRVLAIALDGIVVDSDDKEILCSLKGTLKQEKNRAKNLIAVGDFVEFEPKGEHCGVITRVKERHSILSRADNLSRHKEQLIAVNIDQVLITSSVLHPPLKPFLIDRYIIAAEKGGMQPLIVINKTDLLDHPPLDLSPNDLAAEKALYAEALAAYATLSIPVFPVSTVTGQGIPELCAAMKGKTSVFSGQSGTGKSSLINLLVGTQQRVGSIVQKTGKGSHTTTSTHLVPLSCGGFCIDTPGIKSFGLWDLKKEDLVHYFPEFLPFSAHCRFPDCSHLTEPDCAVQGAVDKGELSSLRFNSYSALMESLSTPHRLR